MGFSRRQATAGIAVAVLVGLLATPAASAPPTAATGPSTVTAPYVLPTADDVRITSLLTVDDAGRARNGYEMVGIPDGLGVRELPNGRVSVFMNQELASNQGIQRRHGEQGAFVAELRVDAATDEVWFGQDLINPNIRYWDYLQGRYRNVPNVAGTQPDGDAFPAFDARFARFCSGSLTDPGQLYNEATRRGYDGQLYFANEENGDDSRSFGVTVTGTAYQLPRLGLFSWENTLAAPNQSDTTLVMGQEDAGTGQIWAYVGTKERRGTPVEEAGLSNGTSFVADLLNEAVSSDSQFRATFGLNTPAPFDLSEVDWDQRGADQNADGAAEGLTLNRIEDGAFDPQHPDDFYFVTTAGGNGPGGGLWRITWDDIEDPLAGGTLTLLLDGSEGLVSPDNVDIDAHGNLLIQEDPGGNPHVARIMAYRIADGALGTVAQFDPALFGAGAPGLITIDEESSGIVDVEGVYGGPGSFLFDAQVHAATVNNVTEYVQRGQLLLLEVGNWADVYGGA